jgi:UDP-N-acetylmuramate: L-alanyl-gamma-D-glutamyl-meso-diaminopimelate ligase
VQDIVAHLAAEARSGDIFLVMSNGAFGGIHDRLLQAFAARPSAARDLA